MDNTDKKIVIFDDDEDILSICSFILEEQGWTVYAYTDCNNITEKISAVVPDIIIMDNWIPDDGGIIATQTLKKHPTLKDIPVIYFFRPTAILSYWPAMPAPKLTWRNPSTWKTWKTLLTKCC